MLWQVFDSQPYEYHFDSSDTFLSSRHRKNNYFVPMAGKKSHQNPFLLLLIWMFCLLCHSNLPLDMCAREALQNCLLNVIIYRYSRIGKIRLKYLRWRGKIELYCLNCYAWKPFQSGLTKGVLLDRRFWAEVLNLVPLKSMIIFTTEIGKEEEHPKCCIAALSEWFVMFFLSWLPLILFPTIPSAIINVWK